jgi:hypothetical protein
MDELDQFYSDLKQGISIGELRLRFPEILRFVHENELTPDMRLAKGRVKELRDEIAPGFAFAQTIHSDVDILQFPLNSGPIDLSISGPAGNIRRVQITIAQARERFNLMTELNEAGLSAGYLGHTDDEPTANFKEAMARGRIMHSTSGPQRTLIKAISLCLKRKSDPKGADTLLIEAPLNSLPEGRIVEILPELSDLARLSAFEQVYVIGTTERRGTPLAIKQK